MVILETGRGAHWLIYGIFSRTVSFTLYGQGLAGFFVAHCEVCGAGVRRIFAGVCRCSQGTLIFAQCSQCPQFVCFVFLLTTDTANIRRECLPSSRSLLDICPLLFVRPVAHGLGKKRIIWHVFNEGVAPALCAFKFKLTGTHGQIYRRSKARIRQGYPMRF